MEFIERENVKRGPDFSAGELIQNHPLVGWLKKEEKDITLDDTAVFYNSCK